MNVISTTLLHDQEMLRFSLIKTYEWIQFLPYYVYLVLNLEKKIILSISIWAILTLEIK